MRAFLISLVMLVVITGASAIILDNIDMSSERVYSTDSTSLSC